MAIPRVECGVSDGCGDEYVEQAKCHVEPSDEQVIGGQANTSIEQNFVLGKGKHGHPVGLHIKVALAT